MSVVVTCHEILLEHDNSSNHTILELGWFMTSGHELYYQIPQTHKTNI